MRWLLRALAAGVLPLLANHAAGQLRSLDAETAAKVQAAEQCFNDGLDDHLLKNPTIPARRSAHTRIYVAEQVAKALAAEQRAGGSPSSLKFVTAEAFCKTSLLEPYLASLPSAIAEIEKQQDPVLALLGGREVESTSVVAKTYQNVIGKHTYGHYDLTRDALSKFGETRGKFSTTATDLIARASQSPDLYRWKDERYHAHSPTYERNSPAQRRQKIDEGRERFAKLVNNLTGVFAEYAEQGKVGLALFSVGVLSHAVQDLTYHRGMTMEQHAGLAFVVSRNPDTPIGPREAERKSEAISNTLWVLDRLQQRVSVDTWKRLLIWEPTSNEAFSGLAKEFFGSQGNSPSEDNAVGELVAYYLLSVQYRTGAISADDLEERPCSADTGLACWDVPQILAELVMPERVALSTRMEPR